MDSLKGPHRLKDVARHGSSMAATSEGAPANSPAAAAGSVDPAQLLHQLPWSAWTTFEEACAWLAAIVESSEDAIIGLSPDGILLSWNPGAEQLFGHNAEEAIGRHISLLTPPERREEQAGIVERAGRGERIPPYETVRCRKDGSLVSVSVRSSPVRDPSGKVAGISAIHRDISARIQLEEQLRQALKMEAIGRLAGGVAHDFNNLLTIITGCTQVLLTAEELPDQCRALLEEIDKAGERAANLTRQLLAFSRKQVLQPRVLDLNLLIRDLVKMLPRLMGADVAVKTYLAADLQHIKADPGQVEQVLMNLAVNARDAMPAGGQLTMATTNVVLDKAFVAAHSEARPGAYVLLTVSDTGYGMDESTQARIFEPFFTTKEPGQGTGLGLATVYGIVKQSGGHILVTSQFGQGSTFQIYLPAITALSSAESAQARSPLPRGWETVLLVEDEPSVLGVMRHLLHASGYTVLEATNGAQALELAARHARPIHLLLTDVVMPQMNGLQLAKQLMEMRPGIQILYLSGHVNALVSDDTSLTETHFLQKPFTLEALAAKVRLLLDRSS